MDTLWSIKVLADCVRFVSSALIVIFLTSYLLLRPAEHWVVRRVYLLRLALCSVNGTVHS